MALRPSWSGNLKLSLITIPIRLYRAVSSTAKTSLNMLHEGCNQRIHYQYTCPLHGEVEKDDIVKGYQYEKGRYVVLDDATLNKVKVETSRILEIVQFVPETELDPVYLDIPYYLAPDGAVAEEAYRVLREAMRRAGKVGIGRVTMSGHEHVVTIRPKENGLLLTTLHYEQEVRKANPYFSEIREGTLNEEEVDLARQLIDNKSKPFEPTAFHDRYEDALHQAIDAKLKGQEPEVVQVEEVGKVVNFMEALKRSLAEEKETRPKPHHPPEKKTARKTTERGRQQKKG